MRCDEQLRDVKRTRTCSSWARSAVELPLFAASRRFSSEGCAALTAAAAHKAQDDTPPTVATLKYNNAMTLVDLHCHSSAQCCLWRRIALQSIHAAQVTRAGAGCSKTTHTQQLPARVYSATTTTTTSARARRATAAGVRARAVNYGA
jgi:hypothetical protein